MIVLAGPGGPCGPCGPCGPTGRSILQNSTVPTTIPFNGPVLHSYFWSFMGGPSLP
jgi:hypothetical protein